ncbi:DUF6790 family protein [Candidatus Margulisiibacteriota bacterium]
MFILFFLALTGIFTLGEIVLKKKYKQKDIVNILLKYLLVINIGLAGIWAFIGHAFFADMVAAKIGWPIGSPFQFEVAMANLAFGTLGILCLWFRKEFWWATAIASGIFLFGDGVGHVRQAIINNNFAPYNTGVILFSDLLMPILIIFLMIANSKLNKKIS